MGNPTNNSEIFLKNQNDTGRLAFILDALMTIAGFAGFGPVQTNTHAVSAGAAGGDPVNIVAGAGGVVWLNAGNKAATWNYLKLYDKATAPVFGDTPIEVIPLPPGGGVFGPLNKPFTLGLGIRLTTGATDADNTPVVAGDITWNLERTS